LFWVAGTLAGFARVFAAEDRDKPKTPNKRRK
jgi:hypothetical protein